MTNISESSLLNAAKELGPLIEKSSDEIECKRMLPLSLLDAIVDAGLIKMLVPKEMGGSEASPVTFARVVEEISRHDGSTGWCIGFPAVSNLVAGSLPEYVAHEMFEDKCANVAGTAVPAPHNDDRYPDRAIVVDGGYKVNGRFSFASGCMHATWMVSISPIYEGEEQRIGPNGQPERRITYIPKSDCQIIDTWNVSGLRGSGSHDIAFVDVFVPEEKTLPNSYEFVPWHTNPLYSFGMGQSQPSPTGAATYTPISGVLGITIAAICLGIAQGAMDNFTSLAKSKIGYRESNPLKDKPMIQDKVGRAEANLRAARAYLYQTITEVWESVKAAGLMTVEENIDLRLASTHASAAAFEVVDLIWSAAGTSSIFIGSPLERRIRDIRVANQNIAIRSDQYTNIGKFLLGAS